MDIELTKESRRVLKSIYDIYCDRREHGQPKESAIFFECVPDDIGSFEDAKSELREAKLMKFTITGGFSLTDTAIIYMENFTKDTISKWLEFGSKFIP